jgi:hypothetical protein
MLVKYWSNAGQMLVKCWSMLAKSARVGRAWLPAQESGRVADWRGRVADRSILVKYWSNTGQILVFAGVAIRQVLGGRRDPSITGQTLVKRVKI